MTPNRKVCFDAEQSLVAIPPAATTTVSAPASAAITSPASAALDLRTRFIHVQCTPADLGAVERCDGFFSVFRAGHLHEAESARAPGVPVGHNTDPVHLSVYLEKLAQFVFRCVEVEVPNKNVLHANGLKVSYLSVGDFGAMGRLVGQAGSQS